MKEKPELFMKIFVNFLGKPPLDETQHALVGPDLSDSIVDVKF